MGARPPRPALVLAAAAFTLSCLGLILFVWLSFNGTIPLQPKGYRFQARFPAAAQLATNNRVRISGVNVGRVERVEQVGLRTEAELEIDDEYAPIPADTRAILRSKTLLGETFVELTPGTRTAPKLPEGETLPDRQIGTQQQVDEVLGAFDEPTREAFKRFLQDLSDALEGRGADINAALGNAGPATTDLATMLTILDHQRGDVRRVVRDGGRALRALGGRGSDLTDLITAGDQVFAATAARNRELTETVRALPAFLDELRATLGTAELASADAGPALRELRPVAPLLRPALAEAIRLAPQLEGLFRDLGPLVPVAARGLPAATRLVRATIPLSRALGPAGREVVPIVLMLREYRREILGMVTKLGAATQGSIPGPNGTRQHYLRALLPLNNEGAYGATQRLGSNRHNPYVEPGGLKNVGNPVLRAFDCRNTGNANTIPPIAGSPPTCLQQQPWPFRGTARAYPHVERDAP